MELSAITLDCADPLVLADFYHRATGLPLHPANHAGFAGVRREGGLLLGFQRVTDYVPPRWPGQEQPQQLHLDFDVDDLAEAEARLLSLGATRPAYQPDPERFLVLTDPAGHPFCLVPRRPRTETG
ncbi:VOC family protein [Streptomyces sp. NPDC053431]|uniref:VOC family protein n=1 Tax=Streptomyces sp. NPDC053431 TaxID=3365703 RepID=UPI0037D93A1E